jgi:hypothetical protein
MTPALRDCLRCLGDGRIANTDDGEPWRHWETLPLSEFVVATALALVRPVACPECRGTGRIEVRP